MSQIYDRRILRTKKLLREAFTRLLQTKPLEKISVKELCDLAGINRSTFYLHYQDLRDLYTRLEEDLYTTFEEKLERFMKEEGKWYESLLSDSQPNKLSIFLETYHFIAENSDLATLALNTHDDRNIVMRIYKKGKESFLEEFIGRVSPQGLSKLSYYFEYIASGSVGILASWVQSGMKETPEEMHAITQEFILRTPLPRLE